MEAKWRTKKRSLSALEKASPTAKRSTTAEPATVEAVAVASDVASECDIEPSATALPSLMPSAESDDPEIVAIFSAKEQVHTAATLANVAVETDESLSPSDGSADGHIDLEPSVDNCLTVARGRCLGIVIEDGVEMPCDGETNGSSQLCHYCARGMRLQFWS